MPDEPRKPLCDCSAGYCNLRKFKSVSRCRIDASAEQDIALVAIYNVKDGDGYKMHALAADALGKTHKSVVEPPEPLAEEYVCTLCGGDAKFVTAENVWRHKSHPRLNVASSFCDKYGYPIQVLPSVRG